MSSAADMKAVVRRALQCPHGWYQAGVNSTGHPVFKLPTGERVSGSWSPGDVNAARNVATRLAKTCGCDSFWDRAGTGRRSRKAPRTSGFDPNLARSERMALDRRDGLWATYEKRRREFERLIASPSRDHASEARRTLASLIDLERTLDEGYHMPPPDGGWWKDKV